jgi:hypothetical protein
VTERGLKLKIRRKQMDKDKTEDQTQESTEVEQSATTEATQEEAQEQESTEEQQAETEQSEEAEAEESSDAEAGTEEESQEEEEKPLTRRENKRLQQVLKKLQENPQAPQQQPRQTQSPQIEDGEYTGDELNKRFGEYGDQRYSEGLQQAQVALGFQTRLEIDAPRVASKYPVLDPNNNNFDPGVATLLNEQYLRTVGFDDRTGNVRNPNLRYEEYMDAMMEVVDTLSSSKSADATQNAAKQASKMGVRPSGVAKKSYQGDDPRRMSNEQLTQAINDGLGIRPR